jgi:hypothetical protein
MRLLQPTQQQQSVMAAFALSMLRQRLVLASHIVLYDSLKERCALLAVDKNNLMLQ